MGKKYKRKSKRKSHVKMLQDTEDMALSANSSAAQSPVDSAEEDVRIWFDSSPTVENDNALSSALTPDTPEKPLCKKSKREDSENGARNDDKSMDLLSAIRELSIKHDATFQKISAIEKTTRVTSKEVESISATVKQLVNDVSENRKELKLMQNEMQTLKEENKALKLAVDESRRYSWKPLLTLHGLKESDGEDIRAKVIEILARVTPGIRDGLQVGVDIVHRLRPKEQGKNRAVIILFAARRVRDTVWLAARNCGFLRENNLRFTEPLSPEDRVARNKLWPLLKKAREEGKKASFKGSFALIDGKKFPFSEVK